MKVLAAVLMSLTVNVAHAEGPEVWWATHVDCNIFMRALRLQLREVDGNAAKNSFAGSGIDNYESLNFPTCTNDDDSITCSGTSSFAQRGLKLVISRNHDGTFKGDLNGQTLGCLLSR